MRFEWWIVHIFNIFLTFISTCGVQINQIPISPFQWCIFALRSFSIKNRLTFLEIAVERRFRGKTQQKNYSDLMGQNDSESNQSDMSAKYNFCPNFRDEKKIWFSKSFRYIKIIWYFLQVSIQRNTWIRRRSFSRFQEENHLIEQKWPHCYWDSFSETVGTRDTES